MEVPLRNFRSPTISTCGSASTFLAGIKLEAGMRGQDQLDSKRRHFLWGLLSLMVSDRKETDPFLTSMWMLALPSEWLLPLGKKAVS